MDFKQLEVFISVSKHQSFSKAAKELFLTQPTISSHIQNLEKELNTVLINRNNKIITLTNSGEILYEHAISILNNCKKAMYDIKEYSEKIEGIIDLACSSIPETYMLPGFLKYFLSKYHDVQFNIKHYGSQDAICEILNEKVSFGFVGSKINNTQIEYIELMDDEVVLITSKDYQIPSTNGYVDIEDIINLDIIMRKEGSGTRDIILSTLKDNNINTNSLNIIAHVESNESIKEMVRLGIGVSFVSLTSISDYVDNNKLSFYRIKGIDLNRKFYFIYSKKRIFTPLENKFLYNVFDYFNKSY